MIPDPAPPFEVEMNGIVKERLVALLRRAKDLNLVEDVVPILTDISVRLRMDPRGWGDPLRDFRHMKQTFFRGYLKPFIAHYSVHDRIPFVTLWHLDVEPDHPLAEK